MAGAIRHTGLWGRMTGGVIVATVLQTTLPDVAEGQLHYDSDSRLIIPVGRIHNQLCWRPSGTNLPLRHLQARLAPTPPPSQTVSSKLLMAEVSVHSAAEPSRSMIDWHIDWLWFMFLPAVFFRPSVSATAGSSFVNIRASVRVKLLCILSRQRLPAHISCEWNTNGWRSRVMSPNSGLVGHCLAAEWVSDHFGWFETQLRHISPTKKNKGYCLQVSLLVCDYSTNTPVTKTSQVCNSFWI